MLQLEYTDGYCRVSTQKQATYGSGLDRYREDLARYGVPDDRIFSDIESGSSESRAAYNQVLQRVRDGITKQVIVPCFDRFTRSPIGWEEAIKDFRRYGAKLIALSGGAVDFNSPEGIYRSRMDAIAAAYVKEKNQYAALRGWERTRRLNKAVNPPFGMAVEKGRYIINRGEYWQGGKIDEVALEVVQTFLAVGTQRGTVQKLCAKYGLRKPGSKWAEDFPRDRDKLVGWLQNPVLRGYTAYFGNRGRERLICYDDPHEALIDQQTAMQIDRLLSAKSRKMLPVQATTSVMSGLVFCECGSSCMRRRQWFYCINAYDNPHVEERCKLRHGVKASACEQAAIWAIVTQAEYVAGLAEATVQEDNPEAIALKLKLEKLGDDPDFEDSRQALKQRIQSLEHLQRQSVVSLHSKREALIAVGSDPAFWVSLDDLEKRFVFTQLIDRVVKSRDRILYVDLADGLGSIAFQQF
ncbi:MAG: recombinase family protein [Tildeniella nuda ZEHNDER 1965/U140]|jgi:hypothetical protein|nr:recombinase family protein [Tildeniella nuda ZEHNDER 1965/U140]